MRSSTLFSSRMSWLARLLKKETDSNMTCEKRAALFAYFFHLFRSYTATKCWQETWCYISVIYDSICSSWHKAESVGSCKISVKRNYKLLTISTVYLSIYPSRCVALWGSTIMWSLAGASSTSSSRFSILCHGATVQSEGTGHLPVSDIKY